MVEIFLLGPISVLIDGRPMAGEAAQRRRLALLALLAEPPLRPVGREQLMLHLWPDNDTGSARHLLSSSLYVLRKALGKETIWAIGDTVELNAERVWVDAAAFQAAAGGQEWERAVELYGGPFLETFGASISPEFEHWLEKKRGALARQYARCLDGLTAARAGEGRLEDAIELQRRLVAQDPLNGSAVLSLMRVLAASGDRGGALEAARSHAQLLETEFAAAPDPEVSAFAETLRVEPERVDSSPAVMTIAPRRAVQPSEALARGPRRARPRWLLAALVLVTTLGYAGHAWLDARNDPVLAVIPRAAPGQDEAAAYLSFGVAETIDYELGRAGVRMLNSGSSFLYRDSVMDPRRIGRRLEADLLVTVSARNAGDGPGIRVELLRTRDGRRLWLKHYDEAQLDRVAGDAMAEIGRLVGATHPPEHPATRRSPAVSPEVYHLHHRGRLQWSLRTPESLREAVALLSEAAALDSSYAWAFVALADAYNMMGSYDYGVLPPDSAFPLAKAAASRALELDSTLAPALVARATARLNYDWDWAAAEADFRRAIQLNPGYTPAREWLAYLLIATGRLGQAEAELRSALAYSPSSALILADLAHLEYYRGDFARAHEHLDRAATAYPPEFERIYVLRALLLCAAGDHSGALRLLEPMAAAQREEDPLLSAILGYALARAGRREEAEAEAAWLAELRRDRFVPPEYFALIHIALGDTERAIDQLEAAASSRSNLVLYFGVEPMLGPLRGNPRFERLVASVANARKQ